MVMSMRMEEERDVPTKGWTNMDMGLKQENCRYINGLSVESARLDRRHGGAK
jgi:hypothetical protein